MKSHLILVGGFLGAGKTTLLMAAARELAARGRRVGLITNDQGRDLVDTALVAGGDIPVAEVAGGCFCCRFPDLAAAIERLQATVAPDVILAEPVGSCADLVATVLRPLQSFHREQLTLAPFSVLVDPQRDLVGFPADVAYLYRQQCAEADLLLVTKIDTLDDSAIATELAHWRARHPAATTLGVSARTGDGLEAWLALCEQEAGAFQPPLALDYRRYAEAEAALGWLNATGELRSGRAFSADAWVAGALQALDEAFLREGAPVAHVKMQLETPAAILKASLTRSGAPVTWDAHQDGVRVMTARVLLNARVGASPATLERIIRNLSATTPSWITCEWTRLECFSPAVPQPTHRFS